MNELLLKFIAGSGIPLLNFITLKIYNRFTGKKKTFLWKDKTPSLLSLGFNNSLDELKNRAKILVIDDEETFPVKLFQEAGYNIEKWDSVKDLDKLEKGSYDIIILDIMGVATHISDEDGLGILENIKHYNPAQIVIAYSGHSFDLTKARFWELADEKIAKPSDFLKIRKIIDNLVINKYNPSRYIDNLSKLLRNNGITEKEIKKFNAQITKSIKEKAVPNWNSIITFSIPNSELFNKVVAISTTLIKFYL